MTFDSTSTAEQVLKDVDLRGRRILVTGSSSGMGLEIVRSLAERGASVIGTVRDMTSGELAVRDVRADFEGAGDLELVRLDLASLASVRSCTDALLAGARPLDAIIANAGVMAGPKRLTDDGFEMQFGTNYLGHFLLINRLAPILSPAARVACVSSAGHRRSDVDLDDLNFETTAYDELLAYGRSKTALILFSTEFDRRHRERGIRATALHPGAVRTETVLRMIDERKAKGEDPTSGFSWKTVEQGAATAVWTTIVAPSDEVGGRYCEDCHVAKVDDDPTHSTGVRSYALDRDTAGRLWRMSEQMTSQRF